MSDIQSKISRHSKKQKNMIHKQEKNQSIKQTPKYRDAEPRRQGRKTTIISMFRTPENVEENKREEKNERYKKIQMELLEMKNTISEMKNTLDGIN